MMKECYCNHCGTKNQRNNKKCDKCHQKLYEHDHVLIDYLLDQAVDEVKGNAKSKIFDNIKYFLKKYLYGVILSITVVAGITANIIVNKNAQNITNVKPNYKNNEVIKYQSTNDLIIAFNNYYINKDISGLSTLMLENSFESVAEQLNSNTSNHLIFQNIDLFNLHNPLIGFNIFPLRKIIDSDGSTTRAKKYADLGFDDADFVVNRLIYEYNGIDYPLFDFNFIVVSIDNYYYISEIFLVSEERLKIYKEKNGDLSIIGEEYEM